MVLASTPARAGPSQSAAPEAWAARAFWVITIGLLGYLATVQGIAAWQESATADEPTELAAGLRHLKLGDFRINPEHPPVAKMLAAAFTLPLRPALPATSTTNEYIYGSELMRANVDRWDAILFAARLSSILLTIALGLLIAIWTRRRFGPAAALLALAMFAFDPAITAHGHYVKNDVALALFAFATCVAWAAFLDRPTARRLLAAGVALGIALATKFSAMFLLPVLLVLWIAKHGRPSALRAVAVLPIAAIVVSVAYGIVHVSEYAAGLQSFLNHNSIGHPSYLLGDYGMKGWWYYFPIAFAVKMPIGTLAIIAIASIAALGALLRDHRWPAFESLVLLVPILIYGSLSIASHLNLGIRHLLPIWPFLFVACAAACARFTSRGARVAVIVCITALIAESAAIFPHYTAFFNVAAGGPGRGPEILTDSNIDWGQDAKHLRNWLAAHPAKKLCLDYFGPTDLSHLGLSGDSLLGTTDTQRRDSLDCVAAISVNVLYGLHGSFANRSKYAWLRTLTPRAKIGYSIYVYDFTDPSTLAPLAKYTAPTRAEVVRVVHQDFRGSPTSQDAARPGEFIALILTGLGPIAPERHTRLRYTLFPVACQWDAAPQFAEVLYAGLAPGQDSIYQINVRVPSTSNNVAKLSCGPALTFTGPQWAVSVDVPVAPAK